MRVVDVAIGLIVFIAIGGGIMGFLWTRLMVRGLSPRYRVVPHEQTDWGTMFAIQDRDGGIVGLDRFTQAHQRCAQLNSSGTPQ